MAAYLQSADYAAYGITGATDAQVNAASRLIDAYLGTTSGLVWSPDAAGNPGWMSGKTATRSYTLSASILASSGTQVTIPGASFGPGDVGQAVVIDRSNTNAAEICVVSGAAGSTLTLESTAFAHASGATVEFGLAVSEEADVGRGGQIRANARPVARMLSIYGSRRYGACNLRDASPEELFATNYNQAALWGGFPLAQCDLDGVTGSCWMLPGSISPYGQGSRLRISYIAGWNYANLPAAIKQVTANLVASAIALGAEGLSGNIKMLKAGDATIERFAGAGGGSSLMDSDAVTMLAPYRNVRI